MKKTLIILLLIISIKANCQLLSPSRAIHLKECTVRITIPGSTSVGSGFVVDQTGVITTCFHVIAPALKWNAINRNFDVGAIQVEFQNGSKLQYVIPPVLSQSLDTLEIYDICVLVPIKPLTSPIPFLKIGNYTNVSDGDEVVTCGYPFGMQRSFISRGMIGSKIVDTIFVKNQTGAITKIFRNESIVDITLNKGNSGGAIYKIGDSDVQDEVIGIADFIITPVGKDISDLMDSVKAANNSGMKVEIAGVDPNKSLEMIINTLSNSSDGVSGCISIEYFQHLVAIATKAKK